METQKKSQNTTTAKPKKIYITPRTTDTIPELLDYVTLNQYYGLKQSTMSKLVMLGQFCNVVKMGRKNMFRRADVEAWIDSKTINVEGV